MGAVTAQTGKGSILEAGVFSQSDAHAFVALAATGTDAQVQYMVNVLRVRFQNALGGMEERKAFVYLLARFVKCVRFMTCFYSFHEAVKVFVEFADYVGPQLIKQGSVSELMRMIRQTEVVKAAVQYQGVREGVGDIKVKPGSGKKGMGPPPKKITVQDMIADLRKRYEVSDDETLYIRQAT